MYIQSKFKQKPKNIIICTLVFIVHMMHNPAKHNACRSICYIREEKTEQTEMTNANWEFMTQD